MTEQAQATAAVKWTQAIVNDLALAPGKHKHPFRTGFYIEVSPRLKAVYRHKFRGFDGVECSGKLGAVNEKSGKDYLSLRDAESAFDSLVLRAKSEPAPPPIPKIALAVAFDDWLKNKVKRGSNGKPLAQATIDTYKEAFDRYLRTDHGKLPVADITARSWEALLQPSRERSTAQTRNLFWGLHSMYRRLIEAGDVTYNPFATEMLRSKFAVKTETVRTSHVQVIDLGKFIANVEKMRNSNSRDAAMIMLLTGWRNNAVLGMKWADIDLDAGTYTVRAQYGGWKAWTGVMPLSHYVKEILEKRKSSMICIGSEWVFPARHGDAVHMVDIGEALKKASADLGYHISPHDLRRTFATVADIVSHGNLRRVGRLVGHKHTDKAEHNATAMTQRYIVTELESLRKLANSINEVIFELAGVFPLENKTVELFKEHGLDLSADGAELKLTAPAEYLD